MKKIIIIPLLLFSIGFLSCKKETVQPVNIQENTAQFKNPGLFVFAKCDDWKITSFQKERINLTNDYRFMNFRFCPDNTVAAFNDLLSFQGTWYFLLDKGNPNHLVLSFADPSYTGGPYSILAEVEGVWKLVRIQATMISLQTDDGTKRMVFEKPGSTN